MLRFCASALCLVPVLLSARPASAVRAIVQLKECGYKSLLKAQVKEVKDGVQVNVCGQEMVLAANQTQKHAWTSLSWWDPAQQGKKLTREDLKTLDDYLGQYDFARPMGMLGHGMLPPNWEGFYNRRFSKSKLVQSVLKFEVSLGNLNPKLS